MEIDEIKKFLDEEIILEPIIKLEITCPFDYTGAIIGNLNCREGIILSIDQKDDKEIILGEVSLKEIRGYSLYLSSLSENINLNVSFLRYDFLNKKKIETFLKKD